jgi:hypothetical protein
MQLALEKKRHSQLHRLPGLKSSRVALDTLMGSDSVIEFSYFLDGNFQSIKISFIYFSLVLFYIIFDRITDASMRPVKCRFQLHELAEAQFGL